MRNLRARSSFQRLPLQRSLIQRGHGCLGSIGSSRGGNTLETSIRDLDPGMIRLGTYNMCKKGCRRRYSPNT